MPGEDGLGGPVGDCMNVGGLPVVGGRAEGNVRADSVLPPHRTPDLCDGMHCRRSPPLPPGAGEQVTQSTPPSSCSLEERNSKPRLASLS